MSSTFYFFPQIRNHGALAVISQDSYLSFLPSKENQMVNNFFSFFSPI